jgi:hypothetical protein
MKRFQTPLYFSLRRYTSRTFMLATDDSPSAKVAGAYTRQVFGST